MDNNTVFEEAFSIENADELAAYIVNHFGTGDRKCVDYDFNLSAGKMVHTTKNLSFKFDTEAETIASHLLDVLCDDTVEVTEERQLLFFDFLDTAKLLMVDKYGDILRDKIRNTVFGDGPSEQHLPLRDINVISLEITDLPDKDGFIKILKAYPDDPEFVPPRPVSGEIFQIQAETGETLEEIICRKREEGDEAYQYVTGVERVKHFYECSVDMFVDFSFVPVATS